MTLKDCCRWAWTWASFSSGGRKRFLVHKRASAVRKSLKRHQHPQRDVSQLRGGWDAVRFREALNFEGDI